MTTTDLEVARRQRDEWKAEAIRLRAEIALLRDAISTTHRAPEEGASRSTGCARRHVIVGG